MPDTSAAPTDVQTAEDQVAQSLGYKSYSDAVGTLTAAPTQSESDLYNSAYSAAGLDQLQNTITGRQNDLAKAQGDINDNPWLDESSRVGRNNTVTTLANADIKNYQTEYANKLKEVTDLVTRETADNTQNTAANKAKLAALEAQAKQLATEAATATKTAAAAPKTIKGSTTGATYQWDPTTQTFKAIIPASPKAPSATSTPDPTTGLTKAEQTRVNSFQSDLSNPKTINGTATTPAETREQFILQLQTKYPDINPDQISQSVYKAYPDTGTSKSSSSKPWYYFGL
jgi:BMFP domain-containing protein YqiC